MSVLSGDNSVSPDRRKGEGVSFCARQLSLYCDCDDRTSGKKLCTFSFNDTFLSTSLIRSPTVAFLHPC